MYRCTLEHPAELSRGLAGHLLLPMQLKCLQLSNSSVSAPKTKKLKCGSFQATRMDRSYQNSALDCTLKEKRRSGRQNVCFSRTDHKDDSYASLQTDGRTPGGLKGCRKELLLDSHACRWSNLKSKEAASRISQLGRNSSTCSWRKTSNESNQYGTYTELESILT